MTIERVIKFARVNIALKMSLLGSCWQESPDPYTLGGTYHAHIALQSDIIIYSGRLRVLFVQATRTFFQIS